MLLPISVSLSAVPNIPMVPLQDSTDIMGPITHWLIYCENDGWINYVVFSWFVYINNVCCTRYCCDCYCKNKSRKGRCQNWATKQPQQQSTKMLINNKAMWSSPKKRHQRSIVLCRRLMESMPACFSYFTIPNRVSLVHLASLRRIVTCLGDILPFSAFFVMGQRFG